MREDIPVSAALSRLGAIGLQALDYLDRSERPPEAWLAQQRAFLETFKKPQAELRLAIVPSIEKLIAAIRFLNSDSGSDFRLALQRLLHRNMIDLECLPQHLIERDARVAIGRQRARPQFPARPPMRSGPLPRR